MSSNLKEESAGNDRSRPLAICGLRFLADHSFVIAVISAFLLVPCFWHKRIEAGDLGSHTYNAWLAQLISRGAAPGLYLTSQWNNVLVDVALAKLGSVIGFAAAEKIVVSVCVLIFFWGAFAFIATAAQRTPWFLVPAIAMIAYGWTFQMGFMNYCMSLGFGFFATALFWRSRGIDWIAGLFLAGLTLLAHPMGFMCVVGIAAYIKLAERQEGSGRWVVFVSALAGALVLHFYIVRELRAGFWDTPFFYEMNGADQLVTYGRRYLIVAWLVVIFGTWCFIQGRSQQRNRGEALWTFRTALELWAILLFVAAMIPELIYVPRYTAPIGFVVSRLTSITAILGLCVLGSVQARKWHGMGFGACAIIFFAFLYHDTDTLNKMEEQAEALTRTLPYGRRVTETMAPPTDWRIPYINHMVDRACVGRCFTYSNYEASSGQFRIRVRSGSAVATDSVNDSDAMERGEYLVQTEDLPMTQIYQCDAKDFTRLCMRDLTAGEKNGSVGRNASTAQ